MPSLKHLEALDAAATPAPWSTSRRSGDLVNPASVISERLRGHAYAVAMAPRYADDWVERDGAFIAAMRNALPALLQLARVTEKVFPFGAKTNAVDLNKLDDVREALDALLADDAEEAGRG